MSRHRNVRSMNYSEEYEGYDDVYGHSVEDDYTISPSDAAFMYDRTNKPQMSAFFTEDDIAEEDENVEVSGEKRGSEPDINKLGNMNEEDRVRLQSCLDEIRNVIGDSIPEPTVIKKILAFNFDVNKTLDAVLTEATANTTPKPQDIRPAELVPRTDKDDKTSLHKIQENLKEINLSRDSSRIDSPQSSSVFRECSLSDMASTFQMQESPFGSNLKGGSGFKLPSFDSPLSKPETSDQTDVSLTDLASMHLKSGSFELPKFSSGGSGIPRFDPFSNSVPVSNLNFGASEELSLSALAAQHQNSLKAEHENTSLSSLAAEHLRNADGSVRFVLPRLSSPPAKSEKVRPFSPVSVFRVDSPVDPNSEPIDLLSALNPPENRTKLEHPRVTWMDEDDDDDDDQEFISCLPDPTCLLDCVAQGTSMDVDATLNADDCSPVGRVLCERFPCKRTFTFEIAAHFEGNIERFLFDSPSPDDHILIRLGRKLPS